MSAQPRIRTPMLAPFVLLGLTSWGLRYREPRPMFGDAAWPSLAHPLGIDDVGRDFLQVLSAGVVDFAVPGFVMVALLAAVVAARAGWFLLQPVLPTGEQAEGASGLAAASPPRLLIVMVGMLLLEEPNPMVAAAIVLVLYLPVALQEVSSHLRSLREEEVVAGIVAHGLPIRRVLGRHLLRGYLSEPLLRHCASLFTQVAFTQVALAFLFGTSSVSRGLAVSWGMEFKNLAKGIPQRSGFYCPGDGVCEQAVTAFQGSVLLLASLLLFGGLLRLARPAHRAGMAS
jgi:ABC-type dipeptide/oligopeptide/nickel transport system permease subunit